MQVSLLLAFTSLITLVLTSFSAQAEHEHAFSWPNGVRAAVSLSYDDALPSQLDYALPALNTYQLKASFYLTLSSPTIISRLDEWRIAAHQGHELGNHSINHPCRKSLTDREWVEEINDLDRKSVAEIVQELSNANAFLFAIDGETQRTYTAPCADKLVNHGKDNYLPYVQSLFVAMKTRIGDSPANMVELDIYNVAGSSPVASTGQELIELVERAAANGTLVSLTFHGVGGDYLSVSEQAHNRLLKYLAANQDIYWVDTFRNISQYVFTKNTNRQGQASLD